VLCESRRRWPAPSRVSPGLVLLGASRDNRGVHHLLATGAQWTVRAPFEQPGVADNGLLYADWREEQLRGHAAKARFCTTKGSSPPWRLGSGCSLQSTASR